MPYGYETSKRRPPTMRSLYRATVVVGITVCMALHGGAARAELGKTDKKCLQAAAKAVQKFALARLKALQKCRESAADPSVTQCPDAKATSKIEKATAKLNKALAKKKCGSAKFDPSNLGFTGCPAIGGCEGSTATLDAYRTCVGCAAGEVVDSLATAESPGACGNGSVDAGEECDDGNAKNGDGCAATCLTESVCGNASLEPREECDSTATGGGCADASDTCVPAGFERECTCVPPCTLPEPIPSKITFTTNIPSGICGCTVSDPDETACDTATSKLKDLECGKLYVGGGTSAVPPGPTPDGATSVVSTPICTGNELLIGPNAGTGSEEMRSKDCTFGKNEAEAPAAGCFFGPAIPVENNNPPLSACAINRHAENIKGVSDPTVGSTTMTIELLSRTFLTGDLISSRCRGGDRPGAPCSVSPTAERGNSNQKSYPCAVCNGGTNDGDTCNDDTDCAGGGVCDGLCTADVTAACNGGANDGQPCSIGACDGGSNVGFQCTKDTDCPGGGACKGVCSGGSSAGALCTDDTDCAGGGDCSIDDCPGGTCEQTDFTVEPCPICVDSSFQPVSNGAGTCDIGQNKGESCSSTNSDGLTTDCRPLGGPESEVGAGNEGEFIADLPVSLDPITTDTATKVAKDGKFCRFGFCIGGTKAGISCNNDEDCSGGTCKATCHGGDGSLDGVACGDDDDCTDAGQGAICGQADVGAFDLSTGGGGAVRRIIQKGTRAPAPVRVGDVKPQTLVSVFCIPITPKKEINNAASIPGPGAAAISGTLTVE